MAEIAWTEQAKAWLQDIYDYIARDNEEAAWQVIQGIHYRIAYLIRDESTIHILGILHGTLDIDKYL